ncbi:MAG TPA: hypothetical protein VK722_22955 [Candidatus Aquilonibacter sp.]|jgi:hypothetical protein|nr:hypothetical protein [Candidatus Aquilonibacter sp.]
MNRALSGILFALSILVPWTVPYSASAQCLPSSDLVNSGLGTLIRSGDVTQQNGVYTFTYASGVPSSAFTEAFNDWNDYTSVTGVKFVPAAAGQNPDITFTNSPGMCIAANPGTLDIAYDSVFLSRNNSNDQSTIAVAHEIGHLLGLQDKPPNTSPAGIMDQATPAVCATATSNADQITDSDADSATGCFQNEVTKCKNCDSRRYRWIFEDQIFEAEQGWELKKPWEVAKRSNQ